MISRLLACAVVATMASVPAFAQSTPPQKPVQKPIQKPPPKPAAKVKKDPKWTIEAFGGFGGFGGGTGGDASVDFEPGAAFTTEAGLPSRIVPSWYFGDGAVLFNQVRAQFASQFNVSIPQIVGLEPLFADGAVDRSGGAAFGVRLARRLTPRYSVEFAFQRTQGSLELSESSLSAIEASRVSFDQAFRGLIGTIPQTNLQVTASATLPPAASNSQTAITAVVNIALSPGRRPLSPYVTVGVGRVTNDAETIVAGLQGQYSFRFFDSNPFSENDVVTVRTTDRDSATVAVFGGGALYDLTPRSGLRFDLRVHAAGNGVVMELEAAPNVASQSPALALPSNTNPSIQFSNTPALQSSLGGGLNDRTVFSGSGLDMRIHITVGYFFRF